MYTARADALLERGETLGALEAEISRGLAGRGRLLIVEGEAGVGKTRVLEAARERSGAATMLCAAAGQYEADLAFGVVRQLLGPGAFATGSPVPADIDVGAVLHDLYLQVVERAAERPLLIVVDDLQWADAPSVRFLTYLARRLEGQSLALLAGVRTGSGDLAALREPALAARTLPLAPLSAEATSRLLGRLLGDLPVGDLSSVCHEATGGNPFLLETLARSIEVGGPASDEPPESLLRGASADVETWVQAQLDALGPDATAILEAIAILGDGAALGTVARAAERDDDRSAAALDALVSAGLLQPDGRGFAHPLVHAAVREAIPVGARSLATRRAARVLVEEHGEVSRAAALLRGVPPLGERWAAELLREAGERALRDGAPDEAAALWRRCLEEPLGAAERFEATLALGTLECALGAAAGPDRLRDAQDLAPDPSASARAALARSRVLQLQGDVGAKIALLEAELDRLGDADLGLREEIEGELATLAITATSVRQRTLPRLQALRDKAEIEGSLVNPVALAAVAGELALSGEHEPALRFAREALGRLGSEAAGGATGPIVSSVLFVSEAWDEALAGYEAVIADSHRSVFLAADAMTGRAQMQLARGEVAAAAEEALAAIELTDDHIVQPLKRAVLADALVELDRIEEALEATADAAEPSELDDGVLGQMLIGARARVLSVAGRHGEAVAAGERSRHFERGWGIVNFHSARWREATALSLAAAGREDEARALAAETLGLARGTGLPIATALARRPVALLAEGGPELAELSEVAVELDGGWTRLERARTLVELGAALRAAGQTERARAELAVGRELAHRCGAVRLERRAREELLASGARPRRIALSGREALTPAEMRVVRLAVDGLTNPAIADRLVVSRRTVEMHLSNAYRKLGIDSRQALPEALAA